MKQVNIGILGATGAVGQEMIKILEERNFPVASLRPIASARSAGSKISFRGQECTIVEASDDAFEGLDIVLGAAENDIAERFAPAIVKAGAVFDDNSSAFRLDPNVPLVIPEINPEDVKWHKGIISVSYTHLDVYKRQTALWSAFSFLYCCATSQATAVCVSQR